jgi:hypothetical protein
VSRVNPATCFSIFADKTTYISTTEQFSLCVSFGIDLAYLRGQGYDGAASMSGKFKGVQSIISSLFPQDPYVHCASRPLNLATANATDIQSMRNSTGVMEKIYGFLNIPKKSEVLQRTVSLHAAESSKAKLVKLCPTRWVERHESVMVVVELLDAVYYILQDISSWQDRDSISPAMILMNSGLDTPFIISLYTLQNLSPIHCP